MAVGTRCADHATSLYQQKLALPLHESTDGRTVTHSSLIGCR
jgi:hypothetical protein